MNIPSLTQSMYLPLPACAGIPGPVGAVYVCSTLSVFDAPITPCVPHALCLTCAARTCVMLAFLSAEFTCICAVVQMAETLLEGLPLFVAKAFSSADSARSLRATL